MKKIFYVFLIFVASLFSINAFAQNSNKVNALWVHDTRTVNEPPAYYKQEIRADLKQLSTIGISSAYGFSTNLTISPWPDNSVGYNHQLSFNNEGVFYRNGDIAKTSWNSWKRFVLSDLYGKVGINTSNPQSELDVNGVINSKGIKLNGDIQFVGEIPLGNWGRRFWFSDHGDNTDAVFLGRYNAALDASELRVSIGDTPDKRDKFSIGTIEWADYNFTTMFTVQADGKVGIKTNDPQKELDVNGTIRGKSLLITDGNIGIGIDNPQNKLDVNGTIRAKEIKVESNWADFVFKKDYKLPTLGEVKKHIKEKGTLPGVPSESDVKANGVNLGEVNAILLQKIEELTLYVIKQQEEIELLKEKVK